MFLLLKSYLDSTKIHLVPKVLINYIEKWEKNDLYLLEFDRILNYLFSTNKNNIQAITSAFFLRY